MMTIIHDEHKQITYESKTNFLYSFSVLSEEKNDALNTIYAFCRKTDDIVDDESVNEDTRLENLNEWREKFRRAVVGVYDDSFIEKVDNIRRSFEIPVKPFFDLMDGMEMDLKINRYKTFDDLYNYCYRVASTVGLICVEIFGYNNGSAKDYAVNLGIAFQLTNIMRDIRPDYEKGRIYLPLEDLDKFGYTEYMLMKNEYNREFRDLMKFQFQRSDFYFKKANNYLAKEDRGLMLSAKVMEKIYFSLLKKIKALSYDVFKTDVKISRFRKALITFFVVHWYKMFYSMKDPRLQFRS